MKGEKTVLKQYTYIYEESKVLILAMLPVFATKVLACIPFHSLCAGTQKFYSVLIHVLSALLIEVPLGHCTFLAILIRSAGIIFKGRLY